MTPTDVAAIIALLEQAGEAAVRYSLHSRLYVPDTERLAIKWLADKEAQANRASEARQADMESAASRAATAAERAASAAEEQAVAARAQARTAKQALIAAIVATATAIAALVVSILVALHVLVR